MFILQADENSIGDPLVPCVAVCNAHYLGIFYDLITCCFLPLVCWGILRIIRLVICKIAAFTKITCSWMNYDAIVTCTRQRSRLSSSTGKTLTFTLCAESHVELPSLQQSSLLWCIGWVHYCHLFRLSLTGQIYLKAQELMSAQLKPTRNYDPC